MTEYKPSIVTRHADGRVTRQVDPRGVVDYNDLVRYGLLSREEAMRHLYPEEADEIFNPGKRWG